MYIRKGVITDYYMDEEGISTITLFNQGENAERIINEKLTNSIYSTLKIGKIMDYVECENGIYSINNAVEQRRQLVINDLKNGVNMSGVVKSLFSWGAYLSINGIIVHLRNMDFSQDYTRVKDVYNVGDVIYGITYSKESALKRIIVKLETPYKADKYIHLEDIEKGALITGTVKRINYQNGAVYVGISSNCDMLCSLAESPKTLSEGCIVCCKVATIDLQNEKFRGLITHIIEY